MRLAISTSCTPDVPGFKKCTVSISGVPANADILAAFVYGERISANLVPAPVPEDPPVPGPTGIFPDTYFDPELQFGEANLALEPVPFGTATSQSLDGDSRDMFGNYRSEAHDISRRCPPVPATTGGHVDHSPDTDRETSRQRIRPDGRRFRATHYQSAASHDGCESRRRLSGSGATAAKDRRLRRRLRSTARLDTLTTSQTLRGFYESAPTQSAKVTHILAKNPNANAGVFSFNATTPLAASAPNGARRAWGSPTVDVTAAMPGVNPIAPDPTIVWRDCHDNFYKRLYRLRPLRLSCLGRNYLPHQYQGRGQRRSAGWY